MAKRKKRRKRHKREEDEKPVMCYGFNDEGICFSETIEEEVKELEALTAGAVEGKLWVRRHGTSWTQRPDIHVSVRQTSVGPEVILEEAAFKRLAEWAVKEHGRTGGTIQSVEPDPDPILKSTMEEDYASYCMGV